MQAEAGTPLTRPLPRRTTGALVLALAWLALDQVTKAWAEHALTRGEPVPVLGDLLRLHLTYNSGAAFSLGTGMTGALTALAAVLVCVIAYHVARVRSGPWAVTLGLLLGGALGNLSDRLLRRPGFGVGHVVDFLRLPHFPVFNVADIGITTGACLIALLALTGHQLDGTRDPQAGR